MFINTAGCPASRGRDPRYRQQSKMGCALTSAKWTVEAQTCAGVKSLPTFLLWAQEPREASDCRGAIVTHNRPRVPTPDESHQPRSSSQSGPGRLARLAAELCQVEAPALQEISKYYSFSLQSTAALRLPTKGWLKCDSSLRGRRVNNILA